MSRVVIKLPDLGEGTVSSEIVAWRVQVGDEVAEDQPLVEMSTDKAVVEMPAPTAGRVISLGGAPGDQIAVGAELAVLETALDEPASIAPPPSTDVDSAAVQKSAVEAPSPAAARDRRRIMASPATRRRAKEAGVDLTKIDGSGREGRIQKQDLDAVLQQQVGAPAAQAAARLEVEEIRILGVRRVSAQRVADAKRTIPHFSYVEEVDITELERLRGHLNSQLPDGAASLTYLPFLALGLVRVIEQFPQCNARYDAERNVLLQHRGVHLGVATQTRHGLKVPVVHHLETLDLYAIAAEIRRLTEAARHGTASRNELSGSTITVTSLGKLGGLVSTPIINAPEVAIIGVNKAVERPIVHRGAIAVRLMMNLSSSFDHRFIDGHAAAEMIQALKARLEHPATLFMPNQPPTLRA